MKRKVIDALYYSNGRRCYHINVCDMYDGVPYPEVTDSMIAKYLYSKLFIDTRKHEDHLDTVESHAQRIASLIHLLCIGTLLTPVAILYEDKTDRMEIEDGWHRMRAYYYLNINAACMIYFVSFLHKKRIYRRDNSAVRSDELVQVESRA